MFPETAQQSVLDRSWVFIRNMFVDGRAYPLFAMLFGFGLATMVIRTKDRHLAVRTAALEEHHPELMPELKAQWLAKFNAEAFIISRRLVRRRGWWMLLFGAIHGCLFYGDIIGSYALIAVIFAGVLARPRKLTMKIVGWILVAVAILSSVSQRWAVMAGKATDYTNAPLNSLVSFAYPAYSFGLWAVITLASTLLSMLLPSVFIGSWLATTDYLVRPDRHRRLLTLLAIAGLTVGALTGLPKGLGVAEVWVDALHLAGGVP